MEINVILIVSVAVAFFLFLYFARIYNELVALKNNVNKTWSNIDVLCKQRHDELPKLVAACQEYMGYEQETLKQVMDARGSVLKALNEGKVSDLGHAESTLRRSLGGLFALAENYPDLKANNSFQQLQARISGLENSIADRRELYNEAANQNNIRINQFPDMFISRVLGFKGFELLQFSKAETADVNIRNLFNS